MAVLLPCCRKEGREGKRYFYIYIPHLIGCLTQSKEVSSGFLCLPFISCFALFYFSLIPCEWAIGVLRNTAIIRVNRVPDESSLSSI